MWILQSFRLSSFIIRKGLSHCYHSNSDRWNEPVYLCIFLVKKIPNCGPFVLFRSLPRWSYHSFAPSILTCFCLTTSSMPGTLAHQLHFKPYQLGYQPWYSHLTLGLVISSSFGSHPDADKPLFLYRLGFKDQESETFLNIESGTLIFIHPKWRPQDLYAYFTIY